MVKMINRITGTPMWVSDDRVADYLSAGHKKADSDAFMNEPIEPVEPFEQAEAPVKTRTRRARK